MVRKIIDMRLLSETFSIEALSVTLTFELTLGSAPPTMRYYEQRYPEVDELVMVQVRQIAEMGAYVKLVCPGFSCARIPSLNASCLARI
jgi:hypothetical protein